MPPDHFDESLWSTPTGRGLLRMAGLFLLAYALYRLDLRPGMLVALALAGVALAHGNLPAARNQDHAAERLAHRAWGARGIVIPAPVLQARIIAAAGVLMGAVIVIASLAALVGA